MHSTHTFGQMLWGVIFPFTDSFSKKKISDLTCFQEELRK